MDLLAQWQRTRSPKDADAIEALGVDEAWIRIGKMPGSRAKTAILRLSALDDPRLATLYLSWLAQGNWPAPTAKIVWTRIFEHLVALRDIRAIGPLRAVAAALPAFVGQAHRAWIASSIEATAAALAKVKPTKDAGYKPAKAAPPPKLDDLAEPVWRDPDDGDLRQVIADAMSQRGDPQGELITLQLLAKPTPKQRSRARALLAEHATTWLGSIAKLTLDGSWAFERGFPIAVCVDRRAVPRRDWEAALGAPQWATIRTLVVSILETPKWWITAWVKGPANRALAFEVGDFKSKRQGLRIERTPGGPWRIADAIRGYTSSTVPILKAFVAGLSKQQRAAIELSPSIANHDAYAAALESTP